MTITEFLLARIAEDEIAANACAEAFPPPWDVADRGWRVRIYAAEMPDLGDHANPGDMMVACPIEVEPTREHRVLNEGGWLSDRVKHIARHDPARVLAECEAKWRIISAIEELYDDPVLSDDVLSALASVYADHSDFDPAWRAE